MASPGYVVVTDFDGVLTGYNNYTRWQRVVGNTQNPEEMAQRLIESSWSLDAVSYTHLTLPTKRIV